MDISSLEITDEELLELGQNEILERYLIQGAEVAEATPLPQVARDGVSFMNLNTAAGDEDMFLALADFENYKVWGGTGIQEVTILASCPYKALVLFKCGALGFSFNVKLLTKFSRGRSLEARVDSTDNADNEGKQCKPYTLSFRLFEPVPLLNKMLGRYLLFPNMYANQTDFTRPMRSLSDKNSSSDLAFPSQIPRPTILRSIPVGWPSNSEMHTLRETALPNVSTAASTTMYFSCSAEFSGFVPKFIQKQLKDVLLGIAAKEFMKYSESPQLKTDISNRLYPEFVREIREEIEQGKDRRKKPRKNLLSFKGRIGPNFPSPFVWFEHMAAKIVDSVNINKPVHRDQNEIWVNEPTFFAQFRLVSAMARSQWRTLFNNVQMKRRSDRLAKTEKISLDPSKST